jgi:hypothetical protein
MGYCSKCRRAGKFALKHAGTVLCGSHFSSYVEARAKQGIRETGVFSGGRIGVLLNGAGGPVLLSLLAEIALPRKTPLSALDPSGNPALKRLCKKLGARYLLVKCGEGKSLARSAWKTAEAGRIDVLATGHCLEDFIVRMNLLLMAEKTGRFLQTGPYSGFWGKELRLRHPAPLYRLYGGEIRQYARMRKLPAGKAGERGIVEQKVSALFEKLEDARPGTKHKVLNSMLALSKQRNRLRRAVWGPRMPPVKGGGSQEG